jgi:hypothetical protein
VAGVLASLYLLPLLDIGTGISGHGATRVMDADVRFLLPGEGCILCCGGLARPEQVRSIRESAASEQAARTSQNWRRERAGSLRSLNQVAAGLGYRLLEDLYTGALRTSTWLRLNVSAQGVPSLRPMSVVPSQRCLLCALRGTGDAGLAALEDLPDTSA